MSKIIILGSEGFIGSHCRKYFISKGYEVYCADIVLKDELYYFLINTESANYSSIFSKFHFDVCINATGAANVQFSFKHPHTDYFLNTANVYTILDSIRKFNPECAFINLSSAAVYGNPTELPIKESAIINPTSPYGLHKMYSELICKEYHDFFNIKTISLRIFSAYGPGLRKQLFWDTFQKIKQQSNTIDLLGTGFETRDFIYIKDLVKAIEIVIKNCDFRGDAINLASGIDITIADTIKIFVNEFNPDLSINFNHQLKVGDPVNWRADISKLIDMGFKIDYDLKKGLKETTEWQKNQL